MSRPRNPQRSCSSDKVLLWISISLLFFGLAMGYSASMVMAREEHGSSSYFFIKQAIFAAGALLLMFAAMKIDYRKLNSARFLFPALAVALVALISVFYFTAVNGACRWIRIGAVSLQPSEFVKVLLIIFVSFYLSRRQDVINNWLKGLLPCWAVIALFCGAILKEPDLGTTTFILISTAILLCVAGLRFRYLLLALITAIPVMYLLVFRVAYRRNRILAFLNPFENPLGIGYQIRQSLITVGSGGFWGAGLANGKQKLFFLPMPHTDFIYAVIGEELGLWGCALVLLLFLLFFWRGLRIALRTRDPFGQYMALGLTNLVVVQALINVSVVLSLMPNKGLPLPFISMGGSSLMATLLCVGLLLNISSHMDDRIEL
ncbi:MAG TPA: putative lipid II flippase FtsW [Acidobacteriota bacterium]